MKFYHVDSFTSELFKGNPAGVCLLAGDWLSDALMQNIAMENNMAETAFVLSGPSGYAIRWFTPAAEVSLCGHATLAAGHVLFNHEGYDGDTVSFQSRKGAVSVLKDGDRLVLDFPMAKITKVPFTGALDCFDKKPKEVYFGNEDYFFVYETEADIRNIAVNFEKLKQIDQEGIIITAKGDEYDFVSRYFAPKIAIDEDPVTGSAHTLTVPYWQKVLGKDHFEAAQLSKRTGFLSCTAVGDRVRIGGYAVTYLAGELFVG